MNIQFKLALRYLSGRKLRTTLTTLAIVFGVVVIFGLNSMLPSFISMLQSNMMSISGQVDAVITLKTSDSFPAEIAGTVAGVEGVRAVSGFINRTANIPANYFDQDPNTPDALTVLTLTGIDVQQASAMHVYLVGEGRFLEPGEMQAAVISESLADVLGIGLGETLRLPSAVGETPLTVIGLLPPRMLPGNEEVLVSLAQAQEILHMQGKINTVEANYNTLDAENRTRIENTILQTLGSAYQVGALEVNSELLTNLEVAQTVLNIMGVLALLMGGFIIFNTFRTVVAERRRDIGMLRALGASRRTVMGVILVEGLLQGVVGTAAGLLLGYLGANALMSVFNPMAMEFFNTRVQGITFSPGVLAMSIVLGLGVTLLAGLLPARSASKVTPLEALRPSIGAVALKKMAGPAFWIGVVMIAAAVATLLTHNLALLGLGGALFITGLLLVTPALVNPIASMFGRLLALIYARSGTSQLAQGNLTRQPGRTAVTASTTLIGMAILLMAASIVSSMTLGLERVLRKNLGSDFVLVPPSVALWGTNVGASPEMVQELKQVDGVAEVSSLRFAPSRIGDLSIALMGIDPVTYPKVSGMNFSKGDEEDAYSAMQEGRNVIVNGILASTAGIEVGDDIELLSADGSQTYHVVAVASDWFNLKIATVYLSHANLAVDFQHNEDMLVQINLAQQADPAAAESDIKGIMSAYPQFRIINGTAYVDEMLSLLNAAFGGMIALVIFLAVPSLIAMVNTLAIGVIERTREIGMLRAVGATRQQVRKMITAESLILAGLGTALGILAGLYLGYLVVAALGSFGFPMEFTFPLAGVLLAFAGSLLLGIIAAIIPARQAARLEIVEALRYE